MISLSVLFEATQLPIKLLTNPKDISKFINIFKDASSSYKDRMIYAVIDEDHKWKFVGGIVVNENPSDDFYKKYNLKPEVSVSFMWIMHKYRGQKIGRRLLDIPMKKYKSIALTTNKGFTTPAAFHLYRSLGFKEMKNTGKTSYWYWSK